MNCVVLQLKIGACRRCLIYIYSVQSSVLVDSNWLKRLQRDAIRCKGRQEQFQTCLPHHLSAADVDNGEQPT